MLAIWVFSLREFVLSIKESISIRKKKNTKYKISNQ